MATLEKRIEALEATTPATMEPMFIHFVGMGHEDSQIQRVTQAGQEWQRQPDESEQALKDRAQREAKPNQHGMMMFLCY